MNDELLASYLLNEGDAGTRQFVEQWIIENPANQRYFEHFRIIWEASRQLVLPPDINEQQAWERFRRRTFDQQANSAHVKPIGTRFNAFRIAATIIICAGLVALSYFIWNRTNNVPVTVATSNEPKTTILPDESVVVLNKNSSLRHAGKLKGKTRHVQLTGEAFFKVTPDKSKPFVIDVNNVTVTVLGTSFNIKTTKGNTEVVVESGIVKVQNNKRSVILKAGEKIVVGKNDSVMNNEQTKDKLYNYYVTQEFVCDDTPLWKLVEVLNEAYGAQIEIADPDLRSLELTTTFHNEPLDNILGVISQTFSLKVERRNQKIILNKE
jgi:transmembrane sensor